MEIKETYEGKFFLQLGKLYLDMQIARELDLPFEEYKNILIKNGAYRGGGLMFNTEENAQLAIDELTPYLVMMKLTI